MLPGIFHAKKIPAPSFEMMKRDFSPGSGYSGRGLHVEEKRLFHAFLLQLPGPGVDVFVSGIHGNSLA